MPSKRKIIFIGAATIAFIVIYFQILDAKWADVRIAHYDGKIVADQNIDQKLYTGTAKRGRGRRKVRAYFEYIPVRLSDGFWTDITERPVVRAYLNEKIVVSHKKMVDGESVELWRLEGSLDGGMTDIIPGGGKVIKGASHSISGWTIEWRRHPTEPVKIIIITNPDGKSRTFRIVWIPK